MEANTKQICQQIEDAQKRAISQKEDPLKETDALLSSLGIAPVSGEENHPCLG